MVKTGQEWSQMIRIGKEWSTGLNKSGQSIRDHVRTGLDRPEQTKTGDDMLGWVRTCQEENSACQDWTR